MTTIIVGAGQIAREYTDVCLHLSEEPIVVTRGETKANELREEIPSVTVHTGGLADYLEEYGAPRQAILATPIQTLARLCRRLIESGVGRILAEKPLALSAETASELEKSAERHGAQVLVAYNRRHYKSVELVREMIEEDGGVSSFSMDFTEALFRIDEAAFDERVLQRWGIANSSHVIDTAFHLGGRPETIDAHQSRSAVDWHPTGSVFYGTGLTDHGVPFSYHADWGAPGRWELAVNTPERKLILSPMERLKVQRKDSFEIVQPDADYSLDDEFKPGYYRQTEQFIAGDLDRFLMVDELHDKLNTFEHLFGYK